MKKTTPPFCLKYIESDVNIILKFKDTFLSIILIVKNAKSIEKFLWLQYTSKQDQASLPQDREWFGSGSNV